MIKIIKNPVKHILESLFRILSIIYDRADSGSWQAYMIERIWDPIQTYMIERIQDSVKNIW